LAKPNYQFQKRQKEMAKKKKQEEKLKRKSLKKEADQDENAAPDPAQNAQND
jgi:hypothetical protein